MWKRQSLSKCLVLDFCCFHLYFPYCDATGGSEQYPFFRRQCAAVSFQFPYARSKSAQCIKPLCLSSQCTTLEKRSVLILCQYYFTATVKSSVVVSTLCYCFWGRSSAVSLNYHAAYPILLFLHSPIQFPS